MSSNDDKPDYVPTPDDYFAGYNASIEENVKDGKAFEYQKLTHNLFDNESGIKWLNNTESCLTEELVSLSFDATQAPLMLASLKGALTTIRNIRLLVKAHEDFIKSGN